MRAERVASSSPRSPCTCTSAGIANRGTRCTRLRSRRDNSSLSMYGCERNTACLVCTRTRSRPVTSSSASFVERHEKNGEEGGFRRFSPRPSSTRRRLHRSVLDVFWTWRGAVLAREHLETRHGRLQTPAHLAARHRSAAPPSPPLPTHPQFSPTSRQPSAAARKTASGRPLRRQPSPPSPKPPTKASGKRPAAQLAPCSHHLMSASRRPNPLEPNPRRPPTKGRSHPLRVARARSPPRKRSPTPLGMAYASAYHRSQSARARWSLRPQATSAGSCAVAVWTTVKRLPGFSLDEVTRHASQFSRIHQPRPE